MSKPTFKNLPQVPLEHFDLRDMINHISTLTTDNLLFENFTLLMLQIGEDLKKSGGGMVSAVLEPTQFWTQGVWEVHYGYRFNLTLRRAIDVVKSYDVFMAGDKEGKVTHLFPAKAVSSWQKLEDLTVSK